MFSDRLYLVVLEGIMVAMSDMRVGYLNDLSILDGLELAGESHPLCGLSGNVKEVNSRVPLELLEEGAVKVVVHIRSGYSFDDLVEDMSSNNDPRVVDSLERLLSNVSLRGEFRRHYYSRDAVWSSGAFSHLF